MQVTEDVDSPPKDFEVEAARAVSKVEGVKLDHTPENTGKTAGIYKGKQVRPDITGTYNGKPFVMDTKLYKRKYVDKKDVKKIVRDSKALGENIHTHCIIRTYVNCFCVTFLVSGILI